MKPKDSIGLRRSLSLPLVTFYGLGTTIGAGIYVLLGEVVQAAGLYAPVSFLLSCAIAGFSAFSFAELATRFPKSAGEAVYINEGFKSRHFAILIGLMVVMAGAVSSATIVSGSVGYLREFVDIASWPAILVILAGLGLIAIWGITESVTVAAVGTAVEIGGLLMVVWGGQNQLGDLASQLPTLIPPLDGNIWLGIVSGSVLAFYAFLGFEDIVNVVEETRDPERNMPRAIIATLLVTAVLYTLLSVVAVLGLPVAALGESEAPLALLYRETTGASSGLIAGIAIFSILNGALIQMIMGARVLYGMAAQGWLPAVLARVGERTQTPVTATLCIVVIVTVFALWLPLGELARITSLLALLIFTAANLSLLLIKRRLGHVGSGFSIPVWVPAIGMVASISLACYQVLGFIGFLG